MVPIGLCSVAALGICLERLLSLRADRVVPTSLLPTMARELAGGKFDSARIAGDCEGSHLGAIFLAGVANARRGRDATQLAMEDVAATVVHELERYLTALGTIAAISPLLGLLGTVVGMIEVFRALVADGMGVPGIFASGISEALVTTAAGLAVAIPALAMHRYLLRKVDGLVVAMERQSTRLLDLLHADGDRA